MFPSINATTISLANQGTELVLNKALSRNMYLFQMVKACTHVAIDSSPSFAPFCANVSGQ
ncbi:hypothetical protein BA763_24570 [Burkholderia cenocepacia]|nr:hypothetical protein BA763_24570 [Burkholderia cenocepacia]